MTSKPKERRQFSGEVINRLQMAIIGIADRSLITCINCEHWKPFDEKCGLNGKRPPALIIAKGCECFVDCDIPF